MTTAIFFSGPPKAGKSVTVHALYGLLRARRVAFFLERLCPDCEGIWTAESPNGSALARAEKNTLKARGEFFSPAFVNAKCRAITGLLSGGAFTHVLFDMGGVPSPENARFVRTAQQTGAEIRAVVLSPESGDASAWLAFWAEMGVRPLVITTRFGTADYRLLAEQYAGEIMGIF